MGATKSTIEWKDIAMPSIQRFLRLCMTSKEQPTVHASEPRRRAVTQYKCLDHERWAKLKGYGKRWSVETAYSTFKRTFGEYCTAKTMKNITKELAAKAYIYNMLINL